MDVFVGAEYIIGNTLIVLHRRKGKEYVTFGEIRSIGMKVQKYCNENDVDAVILTSGYNIINAVYNFSDYFEYIAPVLPGDEPKIRIRKGTSISGLKQRFMGYLPLEVVWVLMLELPRYVPRADADDRCRRSET